MSALHATSGTRRRINSCVPELVLMVDPPDEVEIPPVETKQRYFSLSVIDSAFLQVPTNKCASTSSYGVKPILSSTVDGLPNVTPHLSHSMNIEVNGAKSKGSHGSLYAISLPNLSPCGSCPNSIELFSSDLESDDVFSSDHDQADCIGNATFDICTHVKEEVRPEPDQNKEKLAEINAALQLLEKERVTLDKHAQILESLQQQFKRQYKVLEKSKEAYDFKLNHYNGLRNEKERTEKKIKITRKKLEAAHADLKVVKENFQEEVLRRKLELEQHLKEVECNCTVANTKLLKLAASMEELQNRFDSAGAIVRDAVNKRTELYHLLDVQKQQVSEMQLIDEETGLDVIDYSDPLYFIESDYPFLKETPGNELEKIKKFENPKQCVEAMNSFVKVIYKNIHRFKHLPVGPLYQNMCVKEKKWAHLVEHILRPYVFSFLVDNIIDGIVMEELIQEYFPDTAPGSVDNRGVVCPTHYIYAFDNAYEVGARITAVGALDMENLVEAIHFDNQIWSKYLSETISIEKILLMKNENEAFLMMAHMKTSSDHCTVAYTLDGFEVDPFPCFWAKKIKIYPRIMYLQCAPAYDVMRVQFKVFGTQRKITAVDAELVPKRRAQLEIANQIDTFRPKLLAAQKENDDLQKLRRKLMSEAKKKLTISGKERKIIKLQSHLEQLEKQMKQLLKDIHVKHLELQRLMEMGKNEVDYTEAIRLQIKEDENAFFSKRNDFWKREEKLLKDAESLKKTENQD